MKPMYPTAFFPCKRFRKPIGGLKVDEVMCDKCGVHKSYHGRGQKGSFHGNLINPIATKRGWRKRT